MSDLRIQANDERIAKLWEAARLATRKAFLTKAGSTAYGAAVLTATGEIFSSGQYSSFNHITNIHAEMGAILMATMLYEPDIVALAIVSTASLDKPERPCGICREFMNEHAQRIGHDILICMGNMDGTLCEFSSIAELLPYRWTPASHEVHTKNAATSTPSLAWHCLPFVPGTTPLHFGDMIQHQGRFLSIVWEPNWTPGVALVKVKYDGTAQPQEGKKVAKLSHSFTQYPQYIQEIQKLGLASRLPWGDWACMVPYNQIQGILPRIPISQVGLASIEPLTALLAAHQIGLKSVFATSSWAAGVQTKSSDIDIIIQAPPANIHALRIAIANAILQGTFQKTPGSGTWDYLQKITGNTQRILEEKRFAETFAIPRQDGIAKCSIIYTRPGHVSFSLPSHIENATLQTLEGQVIEAVENCYKRANYVIQQHNGRRVRVTCWHKLAGLLRPNDMIKVTGVFIPGDSEDQLLQMDTERHSIQWLMMAKE